MKKINLFNKKMNIIILFTLINIVSSFNTTIYISNTTTVSTLTKTIEPEEKRVDLQFVICFVIYFSFFLIATSCMIMFRYKKEYFLYNGRNNWRNNNNHIINNNIYNQSYKKPQLDMTKINLENSYDIIFVEYNEDDINCTVCLENINMIDKDIIKFKKCNHMFHKECIDEWIKINKSCPICRVDIIIDEKIEK